MRAALYLRSSKDRADVSIDAQRRELGTLAKARSKRVVAEFTDAVESGKDDDREGFQSLINAVRNPRRGWSTLLVLDTSRIARRRYLAIMFERECERAGVELVYKSMPETDPVTGMLLKSILQAMDEWHSLTSKAKGLAGMRENVRQGFRAGGRAPLGYQLQSHDTGSVREGKPVLKSKLVPGPEAGAVRAYLQARADGKPRAQAGLQTLNPSTRICMEWNALTYAGHTVWNMHAEAGCGRKRRPRADWVVQRDTHPALITDAQAEVLLSRLETYAPSSTRSREAGYLLTGLLATPDGRLFAGDSGRYRVKGRTIRATTVDDAVAAHVLRDIQSPAFVRAVTQAAHAAGKAQPTAVAARDALQRADARLVRLLALVEQTDTPGPLLRQMEAVEAERVHLVEQIAAEEAEAAERAALAKITEHEVRRLLVEQAAAIEQADPAAMRAALHGLLDRVELDGGELRVRYRIGRPGRTSRKPDTLTARDHGGGLASAPLGDACLSHSIAVERRYKIG
jgi:DNA invertase Pin-like site-specific DNA recombinase